MAQQGAHKLTVAAKGLFGDLQRSAQPVHPFRFLLMLREAFPQFAQQGREGHYSQQDAEECWSQLVYTLRGQLKVGSPGKQLPCQKMRMHRYATFPEGSSWWAAPACRCHA